MEVKGKEWFVNDAIFKTWKDRYRKNNETIEDNLKRVAKFCSTNTEEENDFYDMMYNGYGYPAGRTMSNGGIGKNLTVNNCFVAPQICDSLDDIFDKVKLGAMTHQKGGGIGYDFSQLRPKGTPTSNDAIASGALSFMDVFNAQTSTILQGNRRGANMGVMNVYSMDIEDFITAKSKDKDRLEHFNLTVMVDDDFMIAVENNEDIFLHFPVYDNDGFILKNPNDWQLSKQVKARYIWDLIMTNAYNNGEPGIFFYDNMNKDNNLYYCENIVNSNPCSEYLAGTVYGKNPQNGAKLNPKDYGGACNLGSLLLHNFVKNEFTPNAKFDWDSLHIAIKNMIRLLDNVIDINNFPDKIYENYQKSFRTIGLGVTGLADMLVMLGMKYNSIEALKFTDKLIEDIAIHAYQESINIAKEKGSFPFLDKDKFSQSNFITKHILNGNDKKAWIQIQQDILTYGIRNAKLLSVAPCGTLSLVWGNNCSSGIEPIFSLEYDRIIKIGGQSQENEKTITMTDYAYYLAKKSTKTIKFDNFITALEMTVDEHINMLGVIAKHIDMSVSKTINVPTEYSYEGTKDIYTRCWKLGIKGCTIFRPNAIRQGILTTNTEYNKESDSQNNKTISRGYIIDADDCAIGKKRKLTTGCGSLHCTAFFDPINGDLLETYLSKGSSGGCNNFMIGLSRMISLASRGGVNIESIIDQLNSSGICPSYAVRSATKHDASKGSCCPIAIGNALKEMYDEMQEDLGLKDVVNIEPKQSPIVTNNIIKCPECGEPLTFEGGCNICKSCGYSKCD